MAELPLLALQRAAGNAAVASLVAAPSVGVQRQPVHAPPPAPVAPPGAPVVHHTAAELYAMTLDDFDSFARDQADWHADAAIPVADRNKLRRLLEFAREVQAGRRPIMSGCGAMTVQSLTDTGLTPQVRTKLRAYGGAVARSRPTVELESVNDVLRAQVLGEALGKLEAAVPGATLKQVVRENDGQHQLEDLVDRGWVDDFVNYVHTCRPLLQSPAGRKSEMGSYLLLRATVDPASYHGRVREVRNFHRFEEAALNRLATNWGDTSKSKPLTLILHSALDWDGAYHRDTNLTAVITDAHSLTLMIEGKTTLAEVAGELRPLARRYGQGNRINQVMLAGHGQSGEIEMAGSLDAHGRQRTDTVDLAHNRRHTEAFLNELLRNMASGPDSRIVLNSCLTASNTTDRPLSADADTAAQQVQTAIAAHPSLATYLQNAATRQGIHTTVVGANASIGEVGLIDAAGHLTISSTPDPAVTASKVEYIRRGHEPEGCLKAVLEVWSADRIPSPHTTNALDAVNERIHHPEAQDPWWESVIQTLYALVAAHPDDGELIRQLSRDVAGGLGELMFSGHEMCNVSGATVLPGYEADIYGGISHSPTWASDHRIPLVVYQAWMLTDATKHAAFLAHLAAHFTCRTAQEYLDFNQGGLATDMATLLPLADAPAHGAGQMILALLGVQQEPPEPSSRAFLREVARTNGGAHFNAAVQAQITTLGDHLTDPPSVEMAIGLTGVGAPPPPPGPGAGPTPNVDLDGDGVNDFYIDAMTRRGATAAELLRVRATPSLTGAIVDVVPQGSNVDVIGQSGTWYAIEFRGRTRFVAAAYVRLRATP